MDSGGCATTSDPDPSLQHSDLDLVLNDARPYELRCGCRRVTGDEVVVPYTFSSSTLAAILGHVRSPRRTKAWLCVTRT